MKRWLLFVPIAALVGWCYFRKHARRFECRRARKAGL